MDTDVFLVQYVKVNLCLFISNNPFTITRQSELWLIEKLDYSRFHYKIDGNNIKAGFF
ncbi:MAG: hypothetical protein IPP77_02665 [Bacteroidetes bacterium]|nr:hypothetical protein [Bacteroidota bacterium]